MKDKVVEQNVVENKNAESVDKTKLDIKFSDLSALKFDGEFNDTNLAFRVRDNYSTLYFKSERTGDFKSTNKSCEIKMAKAELDKIKSAEDPNYYLLDRSSGKVLFHGQIKVSKKDKE